MLVRHFRFSVIEWRMLLVSGLEDFLEVGRIGRRSPPNFFFAGREGGLAPPIMLQTGRLIGLFIKRVVRDDAAPYLPTLLQSHLQVRAKLLSQSLFN